MRTIERPCGGPRCVRRRGFTLIELLVVIAIIALLISILLPSLASARRSARAVKCGSNMKQVHVAIMVYTNDYKEYHHAKRQNGWQRWTPINGGLIREGVKPDATNCRLVRPWRNTGIDGGLPDDAYWGNLYDPYLAPDFSFYDAYYDVGRVSVFPLPGWDVWRCPDAKYMDTDGWVDQGGSPRNFFFNPDHMYQTYGFNGVNLFYNPVVQGGTELPIDNWFKRVSTTVNAQSSQAWAPKRIGDITLPSQLIMFQDAGEHMLDNNGDTLVELDQYDAIRPEWFKEYFRHKNGCQTLWGDGHMAAIRAPEKQVAGQPYRRIEFEAFYTGVYPNNVRVPRP